MRDAIRSTFEMLREEPQRLLYAALLVFLLFWILRGFNPGKSLPDEVVKEIERAHITCIKPDETAVWPGEPRQPECGRLKVEMVKRGTVPAGEQATGVTRAICYRLTIENPRWETMGQTRHELVWSARRYSKVAVQKKGVWQSFPDEDTQDEGRWLEYGCPGSYGSE